MSLYVVRFPTKTYFLAIIRRLDGNGRRRRSHRSSPDTRWRCTATRNFPDALLTEGEEPPRRSAHIGFGARARVISSRSLRLSAAAIAAPGGEAPLTFCDRSITLSASSLRLPAAAEKCRQAEEQPPVRGARPGVSIDDRWSLKRMSLPFAFGEPTLNRCIETVQNRSKPFIIDCHRRRILL
jgi:hypothetical protein